MKRLILLALLASIAGVGRGCAYDHDRDEDHHEWHDHDSDHHDDHGDHHDMDHGDHH